MPIAVLLPKTGEGGGPITPPDPTPPPLPLVSYLPYVFEITSCGSVTQELYDALLPLAYDDARYDDALWKYCCSIAGMIQDIEDLSRDRHIEGDHVAGWGGLVDLNLTPDYALPWLGQFVGVLPIAGVEAEANRDRISAKVGFSRGSPEAMRAAAQVYLLGNKTVNLYERDTSPYHMTVYTYVAETVSEDLVLAALMSQKPAGIILDYQVIYGQTWGELKALKPTWQNVKNDYPNWGEVRSDLP